MQTTFPDSQEDSETQLPPLLLDIACLVPGWTESADIRVQRHLDAAIGFAHDISIDLLMVLSTILPDIHIWRHMHSQEAMKDLEKSARHALFHYCLPHKDEGKKKMWFRLLIGLISSFRITLTKEEITQCQSLLSTPTSETAEPSLSMNDLIACLMLTSAEDLEKNGILEEVYNKVVESTQPMGLALLLLSLVKESVSSSNALIDVENLCSQALDISFILVETNMHCLIRFLSHVEFTMEKASMLLLSSDSIFPEGVKLTPIGRQTRAKMAVQAYQEGKEGEGGQREGDWRAKRWMNQIIQAPLVRTLPMYRVEMILAFGRAIQRQMSKEGRVAKEDSGRLLILEEMGIPELLNVPSSRPVESPAILGLLLLLASLPPSGHLLSNGSGAWNYVSLLRSIPYRRIIGAALTDSRFTGSSIEPLMELCMRWVPGLFYPRICLLHDRRSKAGNREDLALQASRMQRSLGRSTTPISISQVLCQLEGIIRLEVKAERSALQILLTILLDMKGSGEMERHLASKAWLALYTSQPDSVIRSTLAILCEKNPEIQQRDSILWDPLYVLTLDHRFIQSPWALGVLLEILRFVLYSAQRSITLWAAEGDPTIEWTAQLQVTAIIQQILSLISVLHERDARVPLLLSFLDECFASTPATLRLVHYQTYPIHLLSLLMEHVPTMRGVSAFMDELMQLPSYKAKRWAAHVGVSLLEHHRSLEDVCGWVKRLQGLLDELIKVDAKDIMSIKCRFDAL
ncbi:MAG: hypothetical protein DHS80DRAFT_21035 [Piptocephalis tieghemiana]|nr:MAG: hypothetical protein DHS80DRAFT_21035 [Piptocephalis tieghemiana]